MSDISTCEATREAVKHLSYFNVRDVVRVVLWLYPDQLFIRASVIDIVNDMGRSGKIEACGVMTVRNGLTSKGNVKIYRQI